LIPIKHLLYENYDLAFNYGPRAISESISLDKNFFISLLQTHTNRWNDWRIERFLLIIAPHINARSTFSLEECKILHNQASKLQAEKEKLFWHEKFSLEPLKSKDSSLLLNFFPFQDQDSNAKTEYYYCWKHDQWDIPCDYRSHSGYSLESLNSLLFCISKCQDQKEELQDLKARLLQQIQFDSPFILENPFFQAQENILNDFIPFSSYDHQDNNVCSSLLLEFKAKNSLDFLQKHIKFCIRTKNFPPAFSQISQLPSSGLQIIYKAKSLWKMG
jgi:hypothetical protein